ncbi:MAG: BON domain-containing protein [Chloroflexi bacterium]|nr:BON domain-containing protein [Chloroflexota bacterium]
MTGLQLRVQRGVVHLVGTVPTQDARDEAVERAERVPGVHGVLVDLTVDPATASRWPSATTLEPLTEADRELLGLETISGTEPDLNLRIGTTDEQEAASEAEPYFPPTDPVIAVVPREEEGIAVLGGFAQTATDAPIEPEDHPAELQRGDEEIAEDVLLALREDAGTTDLPIIVFVRQGVVHLRGRVGSVEDTELAEEVTWRVRGVRDVREELDVEGL